MDKVQELVNAVLEMHKADEAYGTGFYNQTDWLTAYQKTLVFANALSKTDTSEPGHG